MLPGSLYFTLLPFLFLSFPCSHATTGRPHRRMDDSLSELDVGLSGSKSITIAAFADVNADKRTDLITLSSDRHSLGVRIWDHDAFQFMPPINQINIFDAQIVNAIPGDLNYDGTLDLLVYLRSGPGATETKVRAYLGGKDGKFDGKWIDLPPSGLSQPMVLDYSGNMRVDLLGLSPGSSGTLQVWNNTWSSSPDSPYTTFPMPASVDGETMCVSPDPHSNAFLDLDGDCLADLFIVCAADSSGIQTYQVWVNGKDKGYHFARTGSLPKGAGPVSFADMDGDGALDMIFPVTPDDGPSTIQILYNQQFPLCTSSTQENCRSATHLCRADPDFHFSSTDQDGGLVVFPVATEADPTAHLVTTEAYSVGDVPIFLHTGDFDIDGFPDVLAVLETGSSGRRARLYRSVPCKDGACSAKAVAAKRRTLEEVTEGAEALTAIENVRSTAFLDVAEDGSLDIIVFSAPPGDKGAGRTMVVLENNYNSDAFFLKTLMLNGACPSRCPVTSDHPSRYPYGVNYKGATFKYTVIDTSGEKRAFAVAQLPQSSYMPLHKPYNFVGLGRTNNYLEELFVGSTRHQEEHYFTWSGIIPNSQLILIPYQNAGSSSAQSWIREMMINPGSYAPWVLLSILVSALILVIVVLALNHLERVEDEKERREAMHLINFDAL